MVKHRKKTRKLKKAGMNKRDAMSILNILPGDLDRDTLRKKYRKAMLRYHPDKQHGKNSEEREEAEEITKKLSVANEILETYLEDVENGRAKMLFCPEETLSAMNIGTDKVKLYTLPEFYKMCREWAGQKSPKTYSDPRSEKSWYGEMRRAFIGARGTGLVNIHVEFDKHTKQMRILYIESDPLTANHIPGDLTHKGVLGAFVLGTGVGEVIGYWGIRSYPKDDDVRTHIFTLCDEIASLRDKEVDQSQGRSPVVSTSAFEPEPEPPSEPKPTPRKPKPRKPSKTSESPDPEPVKLSKKERLKKYTESKKRAIRIKRHDDSYLPYGWLSLKTKDGKTYYKNFETKETTYKQPTRPATDEEVERATSRQAQTKKRGRKSRSKRRRVSVRKSRGRR